MAYAALPTKNPGDVLTSALWNTYLQGNADSGFVRMLADTTLGADAASISFPSIPATFAHLMLKLYGRSDTAATSANAFVRFNNDSAANYDHQQLVGNAAAAAAAETFAATGAVLSFIPANTAGANLFGEATVWIPHYAGSVNNKAFSSTYALKTGVVSGSLGAGGFAGFWRAVAAINRIDLFTTGNFRAGTRATLYGLPA